jgi:WD40 repeat protein
MIFVKSFTLELKYTFNVSNGGHRSDILSLVDLKNGFLASSSRDNSIKIWDVNNGKLNYTFDRSNGGHRGIVWHLVLLKDAFLASSSSDGVIKIWDTINKKLEHTFDLAHNGNIWGLVLLETGDLASISDDSTVKIWDINQYKLKYTFSAGVGWKLAILENGFLATDSGKSVQIWDVVNYKSKFTLTGHSNNILQLKTLDDGFLASSSWDGSIKIWDITNGKLKYTFSTGQGRVRSLAVLPFDYLASGSDQDNRIEIWDALGGKFVLNLDIPEKTVSLATINENYLIAGSVMNSLYVFDLKNYRLVNKYDAHSGSISLTQNYLHEEFPITILENGLLATGSSDSTIKIWNTKGLL